MSIVTGTAPDVTDDDDADDKTGVMIALLPITSDWCQIDLPHLTLVYAGTTDKHSPSDFNEIAKDTCSLAMISDPLYVRTTGLDIFGDDTEKVNVIKVLPTPELLGMRRLVEHWNQSEYPFNPHCTIGPVGCPLPAYTPPSLAFDRVMVTWGSDQLTFRMDPN